MKRCVKCGNELKKKEKYCSKCGGEVSKKRGGIIKKVAIGLAVSFIICMIIGLFFPDSETEDTYNETSQAMECNVEEGRGQMGGRFNMGLKEFTQNLNEYYEGDGNMFEFENWEKGESIEPEGTDEVMDTYFYTLSSSIMLGVNIEQSSEKINSVNIMGPFNDGSEEEVLVLYGLCCGSITELADIDKEEGTYIINQVIDSNSEGLPSVYKNIVMRFVGSANGSTTFMICPASDDVIETMEVINVEVE